AFHLPFLGKPPLTFWLQGISLQCFGDNAWALRLPNFLESVLTLVLTYLIAKRLFHSSTVALLAVWLLLASGVFTVVGMSVSMDMMVVLTVCGAVWACLERWQAQSEAKPTWRWDTLMALFLSLGSLNKGLVTWVLFLPPLFLWAWHQQGTLLRTFQFCWKALPWGWIAFLHLIVVAPWFYLVQQQQPDFLHYFFVQEHFLRFITPNYGDRYGDGHIKPRGTSWLYVVIACLPWCLLWLAPLNQRVHAFIKQGSHGIKCLQSLVTRYVAWHVQHPHMSLLLCWACWIPCFFTLARSIIITYILAALPPLAMLTANYLHQHWQTLTCTTVKRWQQGILTLGLLIGCGINVWYASWEWIDTLSPQQMLPKSFAWAWPRLRSLKEAWVAWPKTSPLGSLLTGLPTYVWQQSHAPFSYYVYQQHALVEHQRQQANAPTVIPPEVIGIETESSLADFLQTHPQLFETTNTHELLVLLPFPLSEAQQNNITTLSRQGLEYRLWSAPAQHTALLWIHRSTLK
ncbi:MAG: glycosyltransferase family 39 protein, partial [Vampirovibrionales bacterium]